MWCNPVIPISLHKEAKILLVINQYPERGSWYGKRFLLVHKLDWNPVIPISDLNSVIPISNRVLSRYPNFFHCYPIIPNSPFRALLVRKVFPPHYSDVCIILSLPWFDPCIYQDTANY